MTTQTKEIASIVKNLDLAKNISTFNQLLDLPPKQEWVKKHPTVKKKVDGRSTPIDYIPVSIYRKLLRDIFQQFNIEIRDSKVVFNSIEVTLRVHYMHPISGEWRFVDGIGAMGLQTDKGAKAMDAQSLKHDAVQKASPAAKSYAIKNALGELGDLFGASLNSDVEYQMEDVYEEPLQEVDLEHAKEVAAKCLNKSQLNDAYKVLKTKYTMTTESDKVFGDRYKEIENPTPAANPSKATKPQQETNDLNEQSVIDLLRPIKTVEALGALYKQLSKEHDIKPYVALFSKKQKEMKG